MAQKENGNFNIQTFKVPCYYLLVKFSTLSFSNFLGTTPDEQDLPFKHTQLYYKNAMHNNKLQYLLLVNVQVTKACNDEPCEPGKSRQGSCNDMKMLIMPIESSYADCCWMWRTPTMQAYWCVKKTEKMMPPHFVLPAQSSVLYYKIEMQSWK